MAERIQIGLLLFGIFASCVAIGIAVMGLRQLRDK